MDINDTGGDNQPTSAAAIIEAVERLAHCDVVPLDRGGEDHVTVMTVPVGKQLPLFFGTPEA